MNFCDKIVITNIVITYIYYIYDNYHEIGAPASVKHQFNIINIICDDAAYQNGQFIYIHDTLKKNFIGFEGHQKSASKMTTFIIKVAVF